MAEPNSAATDRQILEAWIRDNEAAEARLVVDDNTSELGNDHAVLILHIPDHHEMVRARAELAKLVRNPQRLLIRRWRPSMEEIGRVTDRVWRSNPPFGGPGTRVTTTAPDHVSGLLKITLSQVDHEYAAELEAATDGLAFVHPDPVNVISLED